MFGRYALPSDDVAGQATITASGEIGSPGSPESDADDEYPAENIAATSNTGHLNLPSRPAKLETTSGWWQFDFSANVTLVGAAIIYHNFDAGLDVTLELGSGSPFSSSHAFTIPTHHEDGWPVSPWIQFAAETVDTVRLSINDANSLPLQVGRLLLLTAIRDLGHDVRWGVEEIEEHGLIEHPTELGVETLYDLGGKRRRFVGEFGLINSEANELITLYRTARSRIQPWLLIPDADVNEAWLVRFEEPRWSRTRDTIGHNIFPFRVQELSRGLPWP